MPGRLDARGSVVLVLFEGARSALAECKSVDEVRDWADRSAATQAYARMAKDKSLEVDAAEIRIRAERRLGEMLAEQKRTVGFSTGARGIGTSAVPSENHTPTLAEVGINKKLSARAQRIAAVPAAEFEAEVDQWRERVSAEGERVVARLESSGVDWVDALQRQSDPKPPTDDETDDRAETLRDLELDLAALQRIVDADDKLAAAWDEAKVAMAKLEQLERLYQGKCNELEEMTRVAAKWQRKCVALEKAARS